VHDDREWPGEASAEGRGEDSIGSIFARTRHELGYDLETVAAELRIRRPYLEAIEEGRYGDLPGTPYAIGFVRSYADYLGLDSDTSVALFKSEVNELARVKQELNFPAPKPEGRLPGFALVLISLLVVALAYGGWYYWTESERPFVELLPLPESEAPLQIAEEEAVQPSAPLAELPEREVNEPAGEEPLALQEGAEEPASTEDTALQNPPEEATQAAPSEAETLGEETVPAAPPASDVGDFAEQEEVPAPPAAIGESDEALQSEAAEEAPAAPLVDMDDLGAGQRYGEESAVRIVLLATADSWIQVRSASDELLFTRVLRPGDTYRVPDQPGLTLLTGNAGGLDVVVEGVRLPQLGPNGAVRRDIPLEPEAIRNWVQE